MTATSVEEQLNCAIEATNDLFDNPECDTTFNKDEIREFIHISKACRNLSEEEIEVVVAYIFELTTFNQ